MATAHPLNQVPDYAAATARLRAKMAALGIPLHTEQARTLDDAVIDAFDRPCFAYIAALLRPPANVWHAIEIGPAGAPLLSGYDQLSVALSLSDALAFALGEMDDERLFPDAVTVQDGSVEFRHHGALILRVSPIVYEPSDATARARLDTALKGSLRYGDHDRTVARLRSIPGLEALANGKSTSRPNAARGAVLNHTAADLAARVRTLLKEVLDINVPQHQALELTAALFGAPSWQHVVAHESEAHCFLEPVAVETRSVGTTHPVRSFYRTASEAVWGFARAIRAVKASDPDLIPAFYGAGIGGTALHLTTDGSLGVDNPPVEVSTWAPPQVGFSPRYEGVVKNLIMGGDLQEGLERILEVASGTDMRVDAANARLGIAPSRIMVRQGLTFSIRQSEGSERDYLHVERLAADGSQLAAGVTAIYKASIRPHHETGTWVVLGDYDRDLVFPLGDFTAEDAQALGAFAGIRVNPSPWRSSSEHAAALLSAGLSPRALAEQQGFDTSTLPGDEQRDEHLSRYLR